MRLRVACGDGKDMQSIQNGLLRRSRLRLSVCFSVLVGIAFGFAAQGNAASVDALPKAAPSSVAIDVSSEFIEHLGRFSSGRTMYGLLEWLGGLSLSSDEPTFGGFSGLAFVDPDHFLAISDRGSVLSARLVREGGRLTALADTSMGPLPGIGLELPRWCRDAEGLALKDDEAFVSFEGETRVIRYRLKGNELTRLEGPLPLSQEIDAANQANRGLEAIATIPDGSPYAGGFVILSEKPRNGRILGWIIGSGPIKTFSLPQSGELLAADADFTAQGDLIILERNFSILSGLVVQMRRVRAEDFRAGSIAHIDLLFRANLGDGMDNMEALDIQPMGDEGDSLVSLMSDDNFSFIQSTLLLQFRLPGKR